MVLNHCNKLHCGQFLESICWALFKDAHLQGLTAPWPFKILRVPGDCNRRNGRGIASKYTGWWVPASAYLWLTQGSCQWVGNLPKLQKKYLGPSSNSFCLYSLWNFQHYNLQKCILIRQGCASVCAEHEKKIRINVIPDSVGRLWSDRRKEMINAGSGLIWAVTNGGEAG